MVDNEVLNWATTAFDLEAEAVRCAEDVGDTVLVLRIIGRQIVVVGTGDPGLVEDRKLKIATQLKGKSSVVVLVPSASPSRISPTLLITRARGSAPGSFGGLS